MPLVPLCLVVKWGTQTEVAPGQWKATSRGRARIWFGEWGQCISCIGRKRWDRCVQNNWLGFWVWLGKLLAGQEECMCVGIEKWLFYVFPSLNIHAKFQAAIQPSFHSSTTPFPKQSQVSNKVMQLPTCQGLILQVHPYRQPLASVGGTEAKWVLWGGKEGRKVSECSGEEGSSAWRCSPTHGKR